MLALTIVGANAEAYSTDREEKDALGLYGHCLVWTAGELEDGKSSLDDIARKVATRCESAYLKWHKIVHLRHPVGSDDVRAADRHSNFELTLHEVRKARDYRLR